MARLLLHSGARAAHFVAALIFACSASLADVVERSPDNNDNLKAFIGGQFAAYLAGTAAGFIPEPIISLTGEGVALATDISLKFTPPVFGRISDKSLDTTLSSCYREFTLRQIEAQHKNFFGFNTVLVPEERRGNRVVDPGAWGPLVNTGEMEVLHQNSDVVVSLSGATIDPDATYPRTIRLPEGPHQFSWQAETQLAPVLDIAVPVSIYAFFIYSELKAGSAFSKFFADRAVLKEIIDNPLNARYVDDAVAASIRGDIAKKLLQRFAPDRLDLAAYGIDLAEQGAAVGSLSVPDFSIATARNSFAQNVIVRDSHAPTIATTQPTLTLEATDLGGTRLVRVYDDLIASLDYSDPCDRELRLYSDAPNILPMGTTTIEWTVTDLQPHEDEAVYYAPGVSSTASVTQTVVVRDTQPPIVVAPAGKVIESTATQVDPADLDLGWPLVIDLADPAPIISNDAPPAFPNDSRVAVNWSATDSSGNTATKVQWVTGKTSGSNSAPTVADTTADTRTAELVEIRLDGIDRDVLPTSRGVDLADPLAFEIVDYPDEGQFEAPLRPFFIEDFRLTPVGETDVKGVRTSPLGDLAAGFAALPDPADPRPANEQRAAYLRENYCDQGLAIPLDFVFQPTYVHVVDDGTYYVRDKFWDCNYPDFPGERISKWSQDRELLGEFRLGALDGEQSDVFTVDRDSNIWWTDSGPDVSVFLSAQDLNRIDANLGNYEVTRFAVQPEVVGFEYGITAVHGDPANDLIYVNTNVHIEVYRLGTLELLGRLNVDGNEEFLHPLFGRSESNCQQRELVFDGASSRRYWMTTDSAGNLYMSDACEDLIHKFGPSAVNADGEFVAGPYVGWMGRCDANVPPWNGCNEQRGVTRGFTCADSKCVRSQTFGAAPGQFEQPTHLAMGPEDILYVADFLNLRVQRFGADGTFAGEAKSTGTGVNVGDDPGFVLGNMGKPKAISVNSSTFYVMEAENDADFFLHSFKTIPFHMIEAGPGETDRDGDGYADNSVLLKYRSDYNFPGSSGRSVATDRFTYRVNDGLASSAVAQGNIRVRRTFRPPEQLAIRCYDPNEPATQVACALDEDTSLIVELVAEDPDGVVGYDGLDTLTYSIVRHPRFGSLTLRSVDAGSAFYLYRPDADANGTDNFRYSVSDGTTIRQGRVVEVEERFELTVVPVPDPPVLSIDPVATAGRGFPATVTATYTDADNDPNEPEPVVYVAWGDGRGEAQGEIVETGDNEYDMTGPVLTPTVPGSGSIVASHVYGVNGTPNMIVCLESVDSALPICQTLRHDVVDATKTTAVLAVTEPQPPVGSVFSASLELTNQTPEGWAGLAAPSVRAALRIPTGLAIVAADPRCASGATGVLLCAVGDLAPGESTSVEYQLRARLDVVPVPSYELQAEIEHDAIDVADKIEASADVQVVWIDTDEDGLPDAWELLHFAALRATAEEDADGDGLSNIEEYLATADPRLVDTDNDDKPDAEEVQRYFTNPASADTDVDGLPTAGKSTEARTSIATMRSTTPTTTISATRRSIGAGPSRQRPIPTTTSGSTHATIARCDSTTVRPTRTRTGTVTPVTTFTWLGWSRSTTPMPTAPTTWPCSGRPWTAMARAASGFK
jgi:hypothetical protein